MLLLIFEEHTFTIVLVFSAMQTLIWEIFSGIVSKGIFYAMCLCKKLNKLKGTVKSLASGLTQSVHPALNLLSVTLTLYALVNLALTFVKSKILMSTLCHVRDEQSCISRTCSLCLMRLFTTLTGSLFICYIILL